MRLFRRHAQATVSVQNAIMTLDLSVTMPSRLLCHCWPTRASARRALARTPDYFSRATYGAHVLLPAPSLDNQRLWAFRPAWGALLESSRECPSKEAGLKVRGCQPRPTIQPPDTS